MRNKLPAAVLTAVFLMLVCLPFPLQLLLGIGREDTRDMDNRAPAEWPVFSRTPISELPGTLEDCIDDRLPFRGTLITGYVSLTRALFDRDISGKVIYGRDGWLFYAARDDGDCIASYRGEDLFTPAELRQIAVDLRKTRDNLKKKGIDFVLLVCPNKERIYSEYMPDRYGAPAEEYAALQLVDFLRSHTDLTVVYPYDELMRFKADHPGIPLYYRTDTHWNPAGAYIGARAAALAMGRSLPDPGTLNIREIPSAHQGDLVRMSRQVNTVPLESAWRPDVPDLPKAAVRAEQDDLVHFSECGDADGVLFARHDSFMLSALDYLYPLFERSTDMFHQVYAQDAADAADPDVFLLEVVERYLHRELLKGPVYGQ